MKKTEAQGHFSMTRRAVLGTVSMTGLALAMPGFATEAKAGGTFIWGKAAEPKSLDPAVINDADSSLVTRIIYDGLTRFKTGTTEVEPALAESWDVSEDGLTITFKIRQGVKFHDGTPLDAKAIEMNFERWSDPSSALRPDTAQSGNNFSNWSSYMIQDPDAPLFNSAEAVDPQTFVLQLNRPFAAVLNTLATFPFGIVSPRMLTERPNEINENPVGTGPFKFSRWQRGADLVLERNGDAWSGAPVLDQLVFRAISDSSARFLQLKSGAIHGMSFPNPDDVQIAKNDPSMQVVKIDHEAVAYMGLANNRAPFDNQKVRQAIHMAVPKDDISAAFFADVGETADQFMPSNVMGYSKAISGYPYDPARAKALLAEAGYPDGIDVDLWYMGIPRSYFPDPKSVATALSASLGQIGVRVNLRTEEWGQYVADMTASDKFDMWLAGWSNDNGEPDSFFSRLLAHHNPETDKPSWNNEDLANRIQSGAQNFNREERTATYVDIMSDLQDQSPWIPITRMSDVVLMTAGVEGFVGEAIGVAYDFSKVRFTG